MNQKSPYHFDRGFLFENSYFKVKNQVFLKKNKKKVAKKRIKK